MTGEPTTTGEGTVPAGSGEPTATGAPPIALGTPVRDTARGRVGVVMDHQGPCFQLRPLDGGREWDAAPEHVEPVGPREVLHARVAEANQRSSRGTPG